MSYEHCDKHDMPATNGCEQCYVERLERALFLLDDFLARYFGGAGERDDTIRFLRKFEEAGFAVHTIEDGRRLDGGEAPVGEDRAMAENMPPTQQIERLVRQRNALWRMIEKYVSENGAEEKDGLREEDRDALSMEFEEGDDEVVVTFANPLAIVRKVRRSAEALWDRCREITRENYFVEGVSPATGERYDDEAPTTRDTGPYGRVAAEAKPWRP